MRCGNCPPILLIPSSTFYAIICIHIYVYICFKSDNPLLQLLFFIILCILKKREKRVNIYLQNLFYNNIFIYHCSFLFISCGFEPNWCHLFMPIQLFLTHLFCVFIVKYIAFQYVIGLAVQLHNIVLDNCFLN